MTVSTTHRENLTTATGSAGPYAFTFRILDQTHLEVYLNGVLKTLTTHYTVSLNSSGVGGSITFTSATTNGHSIQIKRVTPFTQLLDLAEEEAFPAEDAEIEYDKLTLIVQELQNNIDNVPTGGGGGGGGSGDVVGPSSSTNHGLVFFNGTTGKLVKDMGGLGTSGQVLTSGGAAAMPSWTTLAVTANDHPGGLFTTSESGLGITFATVNQSGNVFYASPSNGSSGAPSFRVIATADLPTIPASLGGLGINTSSSAKGGIPYLSATGVWSILAIGADTKHLVVATDVPAWVTDTGGGGGGGSGDVVGPAGATNHGLAFFDGTTGKIIKDMGGLGTSGQVLTSGGAGVMPTWTTLAVTAGDLSPLFTTSESGLGITFAAPTQTANTHYSGPTSGAAAAPTFRALVPNDLAASAATGDTWYASSSTVISRLAAGSNGNVYTLASGVPSWAAPTVTAGDLSPLFTTSESGTSITFAQVNQNANLVFAGPASGSAAAPTFRTLVQADIGFVIENKTANFTAEWGKAYTCNTSGGSFAVTIPAATGSGKLIYVSHDTAGNTLTIQRTGTDTLSSLTSFTTTAGDDGFLFMDIKSGKTAVM